ncbi:MAG: hypothetical protein AAFV19_24225 [Pseudomonadota bacterium]
MIFDIDLSIIPANSQQAFIACEAKVRAEYERWARDDSDNVDQNGNYVGSFEPERTYVTAIVAFLDEYSLEVDVEDTSGVADSEFEHHFRKFKSKILYITTRYSLRMNRIDSGAIGTVIEIAKDYRSQIGELLGKIRKIVNQEFEPGRKRDLIFTKIAALQSEIDRDQTTIDAAFSTLIELGAAIGEAGERSKPAIDQLERIKSIFWDRSKKVEQLPTRDRPKITSEEPTAIEDKTSTYTDDEIPF